MLITELKLAPATRAAWYSAGIRDTDHLRRPAVELLALPGITGGALYETVCQLHEHALGLPAYASAPRILASTVHDLEMLRLRIVDGASLAEIASIHKLSREAVRQRLRNHFGLSGEPPAALDRRQTRHIMGPQLERMIALRLRLSGRGMSSPRLLSGFTNGALGREARAALRRMESKGLLSIDGDQGRRLLG